MSPSVEHLSHPFGAPLLIRSASPELIAAVESGLAQYPDLGLRAPMTWDDFRAAAKKVTENGSGQYYGIIIGGNQLNRWGAVVRDLASFAGADAPALRSRHLGDR